MSTELEQVLLRARELLARPGNDFAWSSWDDADEALAEIDDELATLRGGEPVDVAVLFLPTGPIQEVAVSSGWSAEFEELARDFARAR